MMIAHWRKGLTLSGSIAADTAAFLRYHHCENTAEHCADVAREARRIAVLAGSDPQKAELAGWLHDVSAVIPNADRAEFARQSGVDVLPEEVVFPMILHQKLSVVLAREIFGVTDEDILSAVGCHTTLKKDASMLDKVVFVADKISWDQFGDPPYLGEIRAALERSVAHAALVYLRHLWDQRETLKVVHPWMRDAYEQLSVTLGVQ